MTKPARVPESPIAVTTSPIFIRTAVFLNAVRRPVDPMQSQARNRGDPLGWHVPAADDSMPA